MPLDKFGFVSDFGQSDSTQPNIDRPVLQEPVGMIMHVGTNRDPSSLPPARIGTKVIRPLLTQQGQPLAGVDASVRHINTMTRAVKANPNTARAREILLNKIEQAVAGLNLPAYKLDNPETIVFDKERLDPVVNAEQGRPVVIQVDSPG